MTLSDSSIINKNLDRITLEAEFPAYKSSIKKAFEAGQAHILDWWDELTPTEKTNLLNRISTINFPLIKDLFNDTLLKVPQPAQGNITPPQIIPIPKDDAEKKIAQRARQIGENSLQKGETAIITVAGGDGTRLGINGPKGVFPITPIAGKSIFQLHAEKICAIQKRYNIQIPWYIMTSENNFPATQNYFQSHQFFGLDSRQVRFFNQGMLPVVDLQGNLLMDSKSTIVMSPNGHGGIIIALREKGILDDMKMRGIKNIFYHQVDNVLIKIADPLFIGYHVMDGAEMSLKVVKKSHPEEKVGVVVNVNGRLHVIEYSELSKEDMYAKNKDGTLKYNAGNIAIHMISIDFLEKIHQMGEAIPYHAAIKKVPFFAEDGSIVNPRKNNAVKFESFIFDILKYVRKGVIMEVIREEEFSPVKNMEGENSPATSRQDMINLFGRWLRNAGVSIPTDPRGNVIGLIEINPCFALDEEELRNKIDNYLQFNGKLIL